MQRPQGAAAVHAQTRPQSAGAPKRQMDEGEQSSCNSSSSSSSGDGGRFRRSGSSSGSSDSSSSSDDEPEGMQVQYASTPSNRPASARPASAGHVQGGVMGADSSSSSDSSSDSDEEQRHTGAAHSAHGTHQPHAQSQWSPLHASIPSSPQQRIPGGLLKRPPPLSPLRSARADQPHDSQPGEPVQPSTHATHAPAVPPKEVTWSHAGSAASSQRASLVRVDSEFDHSGAFPSSEAHISASAHPTFAAEALASERVRLDAETRRQELALKAKRMSLDRRESRIRDASRAASLASTPTAAATPHNLFGAPSALMLPPLAIAIAASAASASVYASAPGSATAAAMGRPSPSTVARSLHPTVQSIEEAASAAASPVGAAAAASPSVVAPSSGAAYAAPPAAKSTPAAGVVAPSSPSDGATSIPVTAGSSPPPQQQSAGARFVPPPLSTFIPGVHHLCDVCDERQARVFCAQCNQRMCFGTSGGSGGGALEVRGCAVERHRKGGRMAEHRLVEWTAKGAGRQVALNQDESSSGDSQASKVPPQAPAASTAAAPLSSAPAAIPTADDTPLSELPTPPALGALSPASSRTSLCEVCDAHQARVFCAECNLALCWGSRSDGGQEGCVVELHPERDLVRAKHSRFEIDARGGRGRMLPFARGMSRPVALSVQPALDQSGAALPVAAASCPAAPSAPAASAAATVASHPSTLQQVYADPSAWSASHVSCWLRGVCPHPRELPGRFLDAGVCGAALLGLDAPTLQGELGVGDAPVRERILAAVAALRAESAATLGSTVRVDSAPLRAQLRAQARAMLLERGVDDTEEPEHLEAFPESSASASVPYSRAQLHFMLAERNRMIAQLHEENQTLARRLQL